MRSYEDLYPTVSNVKATELIPETTRCFAYFPDLAFYFRMTQPSYFTGQDRVSQEVRDGARSGLIGFGR